MKRVFLLLSLVLYCSIQAQTISYGVKGGLNIAQTSYNTQSARYAYNYGFMIEFRENLSSFAFQPELIYSGQGYASKFNKVKDVYVFDYVAIPIALKYFISDNLNLQFVPQFSYNVKSEHEFIVSHSSISNKVNGLRKFDFGIGAGVGYRIISRFNFSMRYCLGTREIYVYPINNRLTRNSVLQLSLGYFF